MLLLRLSSSSSSSFIRLIIIIILCVMDVVVVMTQPQDNSASNNVMILLFEGAVIDDLGQPLVGALVQFWHTDINGNYNHPNFVVSNSLLLDEFQYFGTSKPTNVNGTFDFITIRPGIYSQRPITHIHYKVWYNGQDILTSQFYFRDEGHTQFDELLQLDLIPYNNNNNNNNNNSTNGTTTTDTIVMTTNKTIYVNLGLGGNGPFTPFQTSGPFYPVIDFFDYDNDLTKVKTEGTETPSASSPDDVAPPPTTATTTQPSPPFPTPLPTLASTESTKNPTTLPPTTTTTTTISTNMSLSSSEINDGGSGSYKPNVSSTSFINAIIIIGWMFLYTYGF